jgi:hypothetical protein
MALAALKLKPQPKLYHATVQVTRVEEWCVEAESAKRHASYWRLAPDTAATSATASTSKSSASRTD